MKIAIGCDIAGFELKKILINYLEENGFEYVDMGTSTAEDITNYPIIAEKVGRAILDDSFDRGILLCGTGIGMCITANKVPGIYAALCNDCYSAQRARKSNNAQVITMGARVIGPELAKTILDTWLKCEFSEGRSSKNISLVMEIDEKYTKDII
jgi:ribose 5-phosphate isomerase B